MQPILSILIPSIPSRFKKLERIFAKLEKQVGKREVEILSFMDNKKRSIGAKREDLVQRSRGQYVAFVDDDDSISDDYIIQLLNAAVKKPDVITFKQNSIIDGMACIVDFDLDHTENEAFQQDKTIKRMPFHVCAFRGSIARKYHFPDNSYGEDWAWCEQVLTEVKTQTKISHVIHAYIFDSETSEAANG